MKSKKLLCFCVAILICVNYLCIPCFSNSGGGSTLVLYNNTFDNGSAEFKNYRNNYLELICGNNGFALSPVINGNTGIAKRDFDWNGDERTFLFNFLHGGINDGIIELSMDFSTNSNSSADMCFIGFNMLDQYQGGTLIGFEKTQDGVKYGFSQNIGNFPDRDTILDDSVVNTLKILIDIDNKKISYVMNGVSLSKIHSISQEKLPVTNLSIALSGIFDFVDNISIKHHTNKKELIYYYNEFNNKKESCVNYSDEMGSISFVPTDIIPAEYNGNNGIAMNEYAWPRKIIHYTFNDEINSGKLILSFDFKKSDYVNPEPSYIIVNGDKYLFYITDDGIYGPNDLIEGYGDESNKKPIDESTYYRVSVQFDFDELAVTTRINDEVYSTRKLSSSFSLSDIEFDLSMITGFFDNLKISSKVENDYTLSAYSDNFGNIFFDDEDIKIYYTATSTSDIREEKDMEVQVYDIDGNIILSKSFPVIIDNGSDEKSIILDLPKFGVYRAKMSLGGSNTCEINFSRAVKADKNNEKVNICLNSSSKGNVDVAGIADLIDNAGFGGVRTDIIWNVKSGEIVPPDDIEYFEKMLDESKKHGFNILALLPVDCPYYEPDGDGGFNTSKSFLKAYKEYCAYVARRYSGVINDFEIGNELNTVKTVRKVFDTGNNYYKLLNAAFEGIKSENPNANVITAGMQLIYDDASNNQVTFSNQLLTEMQNNGNYPFDYFGVHPYHGYDPERKIYDSVADSWITQSQKGLDLLDKYGIETDKLMATEYGWHNVGNSEEQTAAWQIRSLALNDSHGFYVKSYLYDMINTGNDRTNPEHNYGILNYYENESKNKNTAYSAKAAFLALSQWNKLMANAGYKNLTVNGNLYKEEYKAPGKDITVVWKSDNKAENIWIDNSFEVYDMYGNSLENNGSLCVSGNPCYLVKRENEIFCTMGGEKVTALSYEDIGKELVFFCGTKSECEVDFIVARFADDRSAEFNVIPVSDGEGTYSTAYDGTSSFKAFLWENDKSIVPICSSFEIN